MKIVNFIKKKKIMIFFLKSWLIPVPAVAVIQKGLALFFLN